ncbi:MAG: anthranilate phosphoribosyltransferase, partial [candidate division KSB1 bacterium]|nr:anthranilate phosphoribosyltransferase [candidate division KSB1 bacterium]
ELGAALRVFRNDAITPAQIAALRPAGIVISPGPGRPEEAGITIPVIREFAGQIPLLGVCLGHQAIAAALGGAVVAAPELMHGKVSLIHHDGNGLFVGVENPFPATRYHSLLIEEASLPACLEVTARSERGLIMGVRHREFIVEGVQFHPESIMTPAGKAILANFLQMCATGTAQRTPAPSLSPSSGGVAAGQAPAPPPPASAARPAATGTSAIQHAIAQVIEQGDLDRQQAYGVMSEIMSGTATPAQIAALLVALRMKGERPQEVAGFAQAMRDKAAPVRTTRRNPIDLCGTGGDGKGTFNISTVASFVVAGGGVTVAKHGNRSVSSKTGSADVLEALGVNINLTAAQMSRCLDEIGIAFLFAPVLHQATKHAAGPRRELATRTVFNLLGPLTNPAGVRRQVLGVFDRRLLRLMADVLVQLETEFALVVHSADGLDEVSIHGPTAAIKVENGQLTPLTLTPADFGFTQLYFESLQGGNAAENAAIALRVLQGETGAARDVVLANAACGFWVAGVAENPGEGVALARRSLDSGAALAKLEALRTLSRQLGGGN